MSDNYTLFDKKALDWYGKLEGWRLVFYIASLLFFALAMAFAYSWFY